MTKCSGEIFGAGRSCFWSGDVERTSRTRSTLFVECILPRQAGDFLKRRNLQVVRGVRELIGVVFTIDCDDEV